MLKGVGLGLVLFLFGLTITHLALAGINLVKHPLNNQNEITINEARNIFLQQYTLWDDGTPITTFMLVFSSEEHKDFVEYTLDMSPDEFKRELNAMIDYGGALEPMVFDSEEALLDELAQVEGGIGYADEELVMVEEGRIEVLRVIE